MRKSVVAFCDTDVLYNSRFVTYLMEHKSKEMTVYAFLEPETFLHAAEEKQFDAAFVGSGFDSIKELFSEKKIPVLLLSDFGDKEERQEEKWERSVFRYQPIDAILHEFSVLTAGIGDADDRITGVLPRVEVIGIYSPIGHEMQIPFSVISSAVLAEKNRVLYLNLTAKKGFAEVFGIAGKYDIGEAVIRLRKGRMQREDLMQCMYEVSGISYLPPFANPEQIRELTPEDLQRLLSWISEKTDFETVLIDFGDGVTPLAGMLSLCQSICCPMKPGYFYNCQKETFLAYLEKTGEEALSQKVQFVQIPFSAKAIRGGGNVLEQLLWSEFGDFVRTYQTGGNGSYDE